MSETDRFQGMLQAHISLLRRLSARNQQECKEAPQGDPFLRGLKQGSADAFDLCAEWLQETLEKEIKRGDKHEPSI